jgi:hypothetical protein
MQPVDGMSENLDIVGHRFGGVDVIVDRQYAQWGRCLRRQWWRAGWRHGWMAARARQADQEAAAQVRPVADSGHRAGMQFHEDFHQRQT